MMKRCENCFESNSDGATDCVICGDPLSVPQTESGADQPAGTSAEGATMSAEGGQGVETDAQAAAGAGDREPGSEQPPPAKPSPSKKAARQAAAPAPIQGDGGCDVILQVYHDTDQRVVHSHPVVNDITLIGREDPRRDVFPDLDLDTLKKSGVGSKNASREHLRLLRQDGRYYLYVYRGTTGTQVNKDMIPEDQYGKRFEIQVGDRIVLGGRVRLKLAKA